MLIQIEAENQTLDFDVEPTTTLEDLQSFLDESGYPSRVLLLRGAPLQQVTALSQGDILQSYPQFEPKINWDYIVPFFKGCEDDYKDLYRPTNLIFNWGKDRHYPKKKRFTGCPFHLDFVLIKTLLETISDQSDQWTLVENSFHRDILPKGLKMLVVVKKGDALHQVKWTDSNGSPDHYVNCPFLKDIFAPAIQYFNKYCLIIYAGYNLVIATSSGIFFHDYFELNIPWVEKLIQSDLKTGLTKLLSNIHDQFIEFRTDFLGDYDLLDPIVTDNVADLTFDFGGYSDEF